MTPRTRGQIVLAGIASIIGILLILLGVPLALAVLGGNPLQELPTTGSDLWWTLSQPDDGTVFVALITILGWLVWASLALSLLIEIPAALRGVSAPRLPGLRWQQGRAAALIGAVAAMIALSGGAATADTADHTPPAGGAQATTSSTTTPGSTDQQERPDSSVTVGPGDTLWELAENELGDGSRYDEIADANPRVSDPDVIQPGWELNVPGGSTRSSTQEAPDRDTSSTRDKGSSTSKSGSSGSAAATPDTSQSPDSQRGQDRSDSSAAKSAASSPAGQARPGSESAPSPSGSGAPTTSTTTTTEEAGDRSLLPVVAATGIGALTAAGVLTLLMRRRSQQVRHRTAGRRIARPDGPAADAENALREAADPLGVDVLNTCLRSLGQSAARGKHVRPTLRAARLLPDRIEIYVAEEGDTLLPRPWQRVDQVEPGTPREPGTWVLLRKDLPQITDDDEILPAPWPALVTVGFDEHNAHVLLNLEELGSLGITGDPDTAQEVISALAVELITSPWCDDAQITLVDLMPELSEALENDRVVHATDMDHVLAGLEHSSGVFREAYERADLHDAPHARLTGQVDESWTPHLILAGQTLTPEQSTRLSTVLQKRPRLAIAAITCGSDPVGPWVLDVTPGDKTPSAHLTPAGMDLVPQHLPRQAYLDQLDLFDTTRKEDAPGPDWAENITDGASHALDDLPEPPTAPDDAELEQETAPLATTIPGIKDTSPSTLSTTAWVLNMGTQPEPEVNPEETEAEETETTSHDTDTASQTHTDDQDDPTNADNAPRDDEHDEQEAPEISQLPGATGPVIKILGQVEVVGAHGPRPASHRRITELVTYLAMRPGGDGENLSTDLFPGEEIGPKLSHKRQTYMNSARRWLGRHPDGHPFVAEVDEDGYRVTQDVTLDWHRMQDLVGHDIAATSDEDLREALSLVTKTPFSGIDPTRWRWAEATIDDVCSTVADVAHELAHRALHTGDSRTAAWAARQGLLAEPVNETLWRDRITAAYSSGIPGRARDTITEARTALEPLGDDLEDETITLINDIVAHERRHA